MVRIDMASSGFKQFSQPGVLKEIGRDLLVKFIDRFSTEMTAKNLSVPTTDLSDTAYFRSVADFFRSPELLPETLTEAASAIEGMGSPEGHDRLKQAAARAGLHLQSDRDSTPQHVAVEVWLFAPALFVNEQAEQSRPVLTKFHCFGARPSATSRTPFVMPNSHALHTLQRDLDAWFSANGRGEQMTSIEVWTGDAIGFAVRHAGVITSAQKINQHDTDVFHFRHVSDDLILHFPEPNELWISVGNHCELSMYREKFGLFLRGDADYFRNADILTLNPLREGRDALSAEPGRIAKIVLREFRTVGDTEGREVKTTRAENVFDQFPPGHNPIPDGVDIARAVFDVEFVGSSETRTVVIRPPNVIKLELIENAASVSRWLTRSGIRTPH